MKEISHESQKVVKQFLNDYREMIDAKSVINGALNYFEEWVDLRNRPFDKSIKMVPLTKMEIQVLLADKRTFVMTQEIANEFITDSGSTW